MASRASATSMASAASASRAQNSVAAALLALSLAQAESNKSCPGQWISVIHSSSVLKLC